MAAHSGILAWRIPWTEELGGLQSVGSQELDSFPSKEQASFNFMAAVTAVCSDFEPKKIKSVTAPTFSPSICHEVMRLDAMVLVF